LPLADPAGAAATGKIVITAPGVTGAGLIAIMGRLIPVQVNAGDNAATVTTAIVAAINAANLPVTAAVDGSNTNWVDITARHAGALGNSIEVVVVTNQPNVFTTNNAVMMRRSATSRRSRNACSRRGISGLRCRPSTCARPSPPRTRSASTRS
jgi:phage tail sheath gpL-like